MLVHMSPREVNGLQALAKAHGGSLTINPETGLPEAGFLDSLLPVLAGLALGPAGFGLMSSLGAAATVGGITTLATGSLQKGLMAGLGAYGGAGLGAGLAGAGADALTTAGMANYTDTLAAQGLEAGTPAYGEAASKLGLESQAAAQAASNASKLSAGYDAVTSSPAALGKFAMDNGKSLLAATSPMLAGSGVQTTTSAPQTPSYYRPFMYDPQTQGLQALTPVSGKGIKEGGLMSLANGGAVAFADGGTSMTSPYLNAINNPETIPLMSGETQAEGLARVQALQTAFDKQNKDRMEAAGQQAPETIEYTQSPAGLNPSSPTVQTQADADYWEQRAADAQGSPFVAGGGGGSQDNGQRQVDFIKSLMPNNPAPVGPTNAELQAAQEKERAELAARRAAMATNPGDFAITGPTTAKLPDVPATGGEPMSKAQGIQTLAKPDVPRPTAQTDGPPITTSGIEQLVHGSIYDPKTGHYRNPTAAEIGAKGIAEAKNNTAEMEQLYSQYFKTYKPGEVLDFAGGTLTKNADGTATHKYTDANGKEQSYTFSAATDLATVANNDPAIAREWKSMFNYAPPKNTGSPIITTPGPTYPSVPTGGSGTAGSATTRDFNWQQTPIDKLPTIEQKKPEDAMSGESLAAYNALFGKGSTATKQWTTYPGRNYLPNTGQGFFVQRGGEAASTNPSGSSSGSSSGSGSSSSSTPGQPTTAQLNDKTTIPTQSPGEGNHWVWIDSPGAKHWVSVPKEPDTTGGSSPGGAARGGLMGYAAGGLGSLGGYSDGGRLLRGPGDGVSDSIPASIGNRQPARLADGEFVVPARIVSELGNGSTEAGARKLYAMMDRVQRARRHSIGKGNVAKNSRADKYLPA